MKSALVLSTFVAFVAAQSNPLIPSGISDGCQSFLNTLNTNSDLASCLSSLVDATSKFGPTANATGSSSDIQSTLDSLCSSNACPDTTIHSQLAQFYGSCTNELVSSPNPDVLAQYDSLFAISPLKKSLCTKTSGSYCITSLASSGSAVRVASSGAETPSIDSLFTKVAKTKRSDEEQVVLKPNVTTYRTKNVAFLLLQPNDSNSTLCSDCARDVMLAWIDTLNSVPYAAGISNSPMLAGQPDLYNAQTSRCGKDFFQSGGINNAAGGLGSGVLGGSTDNAAPHTTGSAAGAVGAVIGAFVFALFGAL